MLGLLGLIFRRTLCVVGWIGFSTHWDGKVCFPILDKRHCQGLFRIIV
ncbi:hypothetical protein CsSME_00051650 [Camellia sinensis var. sinensis]